MLRELGAKVIEADALGRALMEPGQPVFDEIVRAFGAEVVGTDGRDVYKRQLQDACNGFIHTGQWFLNRAAWRQLA